jgi:hypothetical protein
LIFLFSKKMKNGYQGADGKNAGTGDSTECGAAQNTIFSE